MESSLQSTQEQLSNRVTEVVRHEQLNRRLQAELRAARDQVQLLEEEAEEQQSMMEGLQRELEGTTEELVETAKELDRWKSEARKLEGRVSDGEEQLKAANEQVWFFDESGNQSIYFSCILGYVLSCSRKKDVRQIRLSVHIYPFTEHATNVVVGLPSVFGAPSVVIMHYTAGRSVDVYMCIQHGVRISTCGFQIND